MLGILLGILLLFLLMKFPLFAIPHIQGILAVLIVAVALLYFYMLYRRSHPHKKNIFKILILIVFLLTSGKGYAQWDNSGRIFGQNLVNTFTSVCSDAEAYYHQTNLARANNWKGDQPCLDFRLEHVREKLTTLKKIEASGFVPEEDLTALVKGQVPKSFRQDPNWKSWVEENFSDIPGSEREEIACGVVYVNLCSEYERRHPTNIAKTVTYILQKNAKESGCWPCDMAYIILTVVQALSSKLADSMRQAGLDILKMMMLLWILYATFKAVIFPSKGIEFIKNLFIRVLCMLVAVLLLTGQNNLQQLYKDFLTPFLNLGMGFSDEINKEIDLNKASFGEQIYSSAGAVSTGRDYCNVWNSTAALAGNNPWMRLINQIFPSLTSEYKGLQLDEDSTLITPELESSLLCMTQRLYRQVSPITATGQSLISFSFANGNWWKGTGLFLENLGMWFIGAGLAVSFALFGFAVAFKIIDIFVKFGFILVLMPIFVATAAFPATREFTQKAFLFLLNTITEFLGLTLVVNFVMIMFESGIQNEKAKMISAMLAPYSEEYGENLWKVMTSDHSCYLFFFLIGLFFFSNLLLKTGPALISNIFNAGVSVNLDTGTSVVSKVQEGLSFAKSVMDKMDKMDVDKEVLGPVPSENRYAGQRVGNLIDFGAQKTGSAIDKVGTGTGRFLSSTGIGAFVGVPLMVVSKTVAAGVRTTGKITSWTVKGVGGTASFVRRKFQQRRRNP